MNSKVYFYKGREARKLIGLAVQMAFLGVLFMTLGVVLSIMEWWKK